MSQFGQPPLAAYLPLRAGQNLADLPDKAAALTNLGTLSTSDIMMNSVPIGTIIAHWGTTAPPGYLPCNGQIVNSGTFPDLVTFLGGTTSAALPDLRGEFLRGWDNGRGVDVGRGVRSGQADSFKNHVHKDLSLVDNTAVPGIAGISNGVLATSAWGKLYGTSAGTLRSYTSSDTTNGFAGTGTGGLNSGPASGGEAETRPRNVAVLYCMKAYGALVNTSTANIASVLSELSNTTKISQFGASLAVPGYQKLPSGLILQWMTVTTTVFSNGFNYANLPIAFPTAGLTATITGTDVTQGYFGGSIYSTSQIRFTNSLASAQTGYVLALGY